MVSGVYIRDLLMLFGLNWFSYVPNFIVMIRTYGQEEL